MRADPLWNTGDNIVLRGIDYGQLWYALPVYVVQDTPDLVAIYWPANTPTKSRRKSLKERVMPLDVLQTTMQVLDTMWTKTNVLMLIPPGAAHAVYVMWDADQNSHICWYCNLQRPILRTPIGFDTGDQWLDIVFAPDRSGWEWKDEDELEEAVAVGLVSSQDAKTVRAEGERVIRLFEENRSPFCDGWENWSPPQDWEIPHLPHNWNAVF